MAQFKLIATVVFLILFILSIALNVVLGVLLKNNEQRIELTEVKRENLRLKREAKIKELYIKEVKEIKKERATIYNQIEGAGTNEEIVNIISNIVYYNNSIVPDSNGQ